MRTIHTSYSLLRLWEYAVVFSASLWRISKALQAAYDRWDVHLEKDGCHLSFPAVFFYTGKKHSFNSVNCCRGGKKGRSSNFQCPHKEVVPREQAKLGVYSLNYVAIAGNNWLPSLQRLYLSIARECSGNWQDALRSLFFFWLTFPQSVIQVTGNNLQRDAGRTANLRNQSTIIDVV